MILYLSSAVTPAVKGLSVITRPVLYLKVRQTHLRVENITDSTFQLQKQQTKHFFDM